MRTSCDHVVLVHLELVSVQHNLKNRHLVSMSACRWCFAQYSIKLSVAACVHCGRQLLQSCSLIPQLLQYSCCKCLTATMSLATCEQVYQHNRQHLTAARVKQL